MATATISFDVGDENTLETAAMMLNTTKASVFDWQKYFNLKIED